VKSVANLTATLVPTSPSILFGDLNAHDLWWAASYGSGPNTKNEHRYKTSDCNKLVEWLETYEYTLHNKPGRPTHYPRYHQYQPTVIDLCFSNGPISQYISEWTIDDDSGSDHSICGIRLSIPQTKSLETSSRQRRDWAKANWITFKEIIDDHNIDLSNLMGESDTLRSVQNITQITESAVNASVPTITNVARKVPWWNPNLNWLRTRLDRAERRLRIDRTDKNQKIATNIRNTWNRGVHQAQFRHWQEKLEKTDNTTIWKTIRRHNTHQRAIPPLNSKTQFHDKCDELRNALFPPRVILHYHYPEISLIKKTYQTK
jgi:hypothetical protein